MTLLEMSLKELETALAALGEKPFRAKQIKKWLCRGAFIGEMSDLSKELREKLAAAYCEGYAKTLKMQEAADGTKKYLFEMADGASVESVRMKNDYGDTVCLSTQVGCAMGCVFCASCKNGLARSLSGGEILSQFVAMNSAEGRERNISNIVLMGMGEPLDNYEGTTDFLRLITDKNGFNVSARNISLSTCGIVPKIYELAKEGFNVTLCISLHSAFDEKRKQLIPIAKKYSVEEILSAANCYFEKTGRRIIIEYAVIENFNDSALDADELKRVLQGMNCHVNLIPLNDIKDCGLKAPSKSRVYAFAKMLEQRGLSVTVRRSLGREISGACGQLKQEYNGDIRQ